MQLPEAREAEAALLGAILIDRTILDRIGLEPSLFYDLGHREIYEAMRAIGSRDLDLVVLTELLERRGQLKGVGGQSYIISLPGACQQTYNFESYERIVRDTAIRRAVIRECETLAAAAMNEGKDIGEAIGLAVSRLVSNSRPAGGAEPMSIYIREMYEEMEARAADPKPIYGLETGLAGFDKLTAGLQRKEAFMLSGQPGTGKSLLAFQLAYGMGEHGEVGAYYALEMSGVAMVKRKLSAMTKIKTYNINSGVGMNEKWNLVTDAIAKMESVPLLISDDSSWTTTQLRADLSRLKQQRGLSYFIADYHDLFCDQYGENDTEKSKFISQQLRAICKDLNLAGLIIQSITKAGYHTTPTMSDMSGSTKVLHNADQIAFLAKDQKLENVVNLIWAKVREGNSDKHLALVMKPGFPMFGEYIKPDTTFNDFTR